MSDDTLPAKTRLDRKDWGFVVIVAVVLVVLILAGLYLSYEKNPWADPTVTATPGTEPPELVGKACDVQLWVNDELWIACPQEENPTVKAALALLRETYPPLAKPSAKLRAVSLSRWNLFDARRIGSRFAELIEPLLNNGYWSVPSSVIQWFGDEPDYDDCFHVACTDEKRLATMDLQPGDRLYFTKE